MHSPIILQKKMLKLMCRLNSNQIAFTCNFNPKVFNLIGALIIKLKFQS